jgi:hypothetical protein
MVYLMAKDTALTREGKSEVSNGMREYMLICYDKSLLNRV